MFLMLLQPWPVSAQESGRFPGKPVNSKTLHVQDQANQVFERSDYKRAFFIYRNELAPTGDKYGQYMVGYMYLTGKGVPEDRVTASAWYRLAAERGTKEFIMVRNRLVAKLDAAETARSDQLFLELRKSYGDLPLLMREIRKDEMALRARTGTRTASGSSPMTIIGPNRTAMSGADYYGRIERRMQARLEYIAHHTQIDIIDSDSETVNLDSVEAQVGAHLDTLN